ncbi:unnamed protein product [Durusdinium trenchii]|uniref:Uncharacterized protein n=1 Tax=Durusdinium trenchii TaxID=1381693 RepID=A0ABP0PKZ8_9DINO
MHHGPKLLAAASYCSTPRSSRAGNALLQRELQRASSPLRVLRIVGENLHLLDARNVSLALEKLAAQPERHDSGRMHLPLRRRAAADVELEEVPSWASGQSEVSETFPKLLDCVADVVTLLESKELAKLCSSLSRLRVKEESLWSSVMAEVAQRLSREEFSELDISESFRAMAVAKAALSQSLPYEMADRMQVANWMSPHSSAVVTHAMVTAKHVPSADFLLAVHARCISSEATEDTLKLLASASTAWPEDGEKRHALVVALTEEVLRREPVPSTCRAVLWAVARSHTVLDAVDVDVRRLIHEASQGLPQAPSAELAALASAAATAAAAGRVGIDVAQQVVQVAVEEALPKDLGPQHLVAFLSACANTDCGPRSTTPPTADGVTQRLGQRLAKVVTALSEAQLVRATKAQLKITEECHGATLCSQAVQLSEEDVLLHAICDELLHRPSVSPSCASRIACALAESQHRRLFARLEPILAQKAGHLLPHHQARLAHVRLVRDDAGTPEVRPTGVSVWSLRPAKRVWSGLQEKPDQQVQDPPQDTWQSSKKRRMPTVSLTKTDSWSDTWQGSKWSSWEKDSSWDYAYSSSSKWSWGWPAGASSAKASGSALKTTWEETMPSAPPLAVFGGLKLFVVGGVPIVGLGKGAEFDSNAAPLLQVALDDHTKAESLYETCDRMPQARRVAAEAKKQNIISVLAEISFVRARGRQFPLAAGLQGKRSMMLALAIALSGHDARCFQRCELFLRTYGLSEDFRRLLSKSGLQAKPTSSLL